MGRYTTLRQAIVAHLEANITSALVTDDFTKAANVIGKNYLILVTFWRSTRVNDRSEPGNPTRDAEFLISIFYKGMNETDQDHALDEMIATVEDLCDDPGHEFPIFGVTGVERSSSQEGVKMEDPKAGVYASVTVQVRASRE